MCGEGGKGGVLSMMYMCVYLFESRGDVRLFSSNILVLLAGLDGPRCPVVFQTKVGGDVLLRGFYSPECIAVKSRDRKRPDDACVVCWVDHTGSDFFCSWLNLWRGCLWG